MWLAALAVLLLLVGACAVAIAAADHVSGVVLLQMASVLAVLALLAGAVAFGESFLYVLAVVLALASGPSTLIYAHFLERWE